MTDRARRIEQSFPDRRTAAMAETKMYGVRFLLALMVIALVCVAAAAGLLAFGGQDIGRGRELRAQPERAARRCRRRFPRRRMPRWRRRSGARHAARSRAPASPTLAHVARRRRAVVRRLDRDAEAEPGRSSARSEAIEGVHKAALEVRELVPQLLQSLGTSRARSARRARGHDASPRALRTDRAASAAGHGGARGRRRRCDRDRAPSGGRQRLHGAGHRRFAAARIPGSACRSSPARRR